MADGGDGSAEQGLRPALSRAFHDEGVTIRSHTREAHWLVRATGNMTLSVLSTAGEQILKVDLLVSNAMKAGEDGLRLARTYNDLALLACIPRLLDGRQLEPKPWDADAGHSPFPWSVEFAPTRRRLTVRDSRGKWVAKRQYPRTMLVERVAQLVDALTRGVAALNERMG